MQQFVLGCTGPHFGPTNTDHATNRQKITIGHFLGYPPKMHYSAVQCIVVKRKLFTPDGSNMTHNDQKF